MATSELLRWFGERWDEVPTAWIDTETTGTVPGVDRCVQVAVVRFEKGAPVDAYCSFVDPGMPIPAEATAIHGITDSHVRGAPTIAEVFASERVRSLLSGSQPAAYNGPFDRHFVPPFGDDWTWPWLDCLSLVRAVDRYASGKGRHKLAAVAERHAVALPNAHTAEADARAAGEIFYRLVPKLRGCEAARRLPSPETLTLGQLLCWQGIEEHREWYRFLEWLSKQPPLESTNV